MTATDVIQVLNQTVDWHRTLELQQQAANEPSDQMFLYDNRQTASKVIALTFDMARADADMLMRAAPADHGETQGSQAGSPTSLAQLRSNLDAQQNSVQAQLDTEHRALSKAPPKSRAEVQARINALQGVLDLITTKQGILKTMSGYSAGGSASTADLRQRIDAMAAAIPSTNAPNAANATPTSTVAQSRPSSGPAAVGRFGLWDLASEALRLSAKAGTLTSVNQRTAELQKTLAKIRTSLVTQIQTLSHQGDALAAQASSADSATLNAMHDQLDGLADQFKQASTVLLPLSQESLLLEEYQRNLNNWRDTIRLQRRDAIKSLAIRVTFLLAVLALVFVGAELWRRAVVRYIQDARRRYQLLLLRRIALWAVIAIVVGVAFATELGSIVTFAGLITAGIAVAMQSVLVSIVGYFFLIGKYGIRVGDRVQIGEVVGEVIDLGLVRMYLMELGGKGTLGPTGRVVAFANSIVFQVSSGLFKQISGVSFSWREVVFNLPAGVNYSEVKKDIVLAVTEALKDYRSELTRQAQELERTTASHSVGEANPQVRLQFTASGVEGHVRYPVNLEHAAEIDERVTEALSHIISKVKFREGALDPVMKS